MKLRTTGRSSTDLLIIQHYFNATNSCPLETEGKCDNTK